MARTEDQRLRQKCHVLRSTEFQPGAKFGQPWATVRRAANWAVTREVWLCGAEVWASFLKGFLAGVS